MSLRFVDTSRWLTPLYRSLPLEFKLVWDYIQDNCDRAGFWSPEFDVLALRIGLLADGSSPMVTEAKACEIFHDLIHIHTNGLWQIKNWFPSQYPVAEDSKPSNVRRGALRVLQRHAEALSKDVFLIAGVNDSPLSEATPLERIGKASRGVATPREEEGVGVGESEREPSEVVEIGGGAGGDLQHDLGFASLKLTCESGGLPWAPVSAELKGKLRALFDSVGVDRTSLALKAYIQRHKGPRSLQNWALHNEYWVSTIPPTPGYCDHDFKQAERALDEYRYGEKDLVTKCVKCGLAVQSSLRRYRPKHDHAWRVADFQEANKIRAKGGLAPLPPVDFCSLCGSERPHEAEVRQ